VVELVRQCLSHTSDVPILPQPTLHTLTPRKDDAVAEAKQSFDRILSNLNSWYT